MGVDAHETGGRQVLVRSGAVPSGHDGDAGIQNRWVMPKPVLQPRSPGSNVEGLGEVRRFSDQS